jgi:hypothetical protein
MAVLIYRGKHDKREHPNLHQLNPCEFSWFVPTPVWSAVGRAVRGLDADPVVYRGLNSVCSRVIAPWSGSRRGPRETGSVPTRLPAACFSDDNVVTEARLRRSIACLADRPWRQTLSNARVRLTPMRECDTFQPKSLQ